MGPLVSFLMLAALLQDAPQSTTASAPATIMVDFIVTSPDGEAPADLTAADITLKVGGKKRPLRSLELMPADTPRQILLVVDEPTLYGLEKVAKEAIAKFLAAVRPGDRINYVSTRGGRSVLEPGKDSVAKKVEAMVTGPGVLSACLSDMLTLIEKYSQKLPSGRISLLAILSRGHPEAPSLETDSEGGCTPRRDAMRRTEAIVAASQIDLYLFTVDETTRSWGLDTVAANIGAATGLLTFANNDALARTLTEKRRHYRAAIDAEPKGTERPQRLEVQVNRPKVKVRTAKSLILNPPQASTTAASR